MPAHRPVRTRPTRAEAALDVRHDTFPLVRRLEAPPADVFAAFADEPTRRRWVLLPGSGATYDHRFDVDGGEDARSTFSIPGSAPERLANSSRYLDIIEDRRIVFSYRAVVNDIPRWVSLVTVLIDEADHGATTLTWTEQVAFLARTGDGSADLPHLRGATMLRLNGLAAALRPPTQQ